MGTEIKKPFSSPTFVKRQEGVVTVYEFLVVTPRRIKAIQVFGYEESEKSMVKYRHRSVNSPSDVSEWIVRASDAGGYGGYKDKEWDKGERLEFWSGNSKFSIGTSTSNKEFDNYPYPEIINCKLVNPNEEQIEKMLAANMERVRTNNLQEISKKVSGILST